MHVGRERENGSVLHPWTLSVRELIYEAGFARGGTAWLRRTLATHPQIGQVPGEVNLNRLRNNLTEENIHQAIQAQMTEYDAPVSERMVMKNPLNAKVMAPMADMFPNAPFLFMIRDPRDVAVSYQQGNLKWMEKFKAVEQGMAATKEYYDGYVAAADKPNVTHLYYEDLHQRFPPTFKRLCQFVGVDDRDHLIFDSMRGSSFSALYGRAHHQENKSLGARKGVVGDWVNHLSADDMAWFKADPFWSDFLERHGYRWDVPTVGQAVDALVGIHDGGVAPANLPSAGVSVMLTVDVESYAQSGGDALLAALNRFGPASAVAIDAADILSGSGQLDGLMRDLGQLSGVSVGVFAGSRSDKEKDNEIQRRGVDGVRKMRDDWQAPAFVGLFDMTREVPLKLAGVPVVDMTPRWDRERALVTFAENIATAVGGPSELDLRNTATYRSLGDRAVRVALNPVRQDLERPFALGFRPTVG